MNFFARLLARLRRPQPPVTPPSAVADAEFLEAVAKLARERYQDHPAARSGNAPPADQPKAVA